MSVHVRIETALGDVTVAVEPDRAPLAAGTFLEQVETGLFDGTSVYRIVNVENDATETPHRIEVIQWGRTFDGDAPLPPVAHETTGQTGMRHERGTLSVARLAQGTAGRAFVFCMGGDLASLDEGGGRHPDGAGFTTIGNVTDGWETLEAIYAMARPNHRLDPEERIAIHRAYRVSDL